MRQHAKPSPKSSSYVKLLIIIAFSVGLLFAYTHTHTSPHTALEQRGQSNTKDSHSGRRELNLATTASTTDTQVFAAMVEEERSWQAVHKRLGHPPDRVLKEMVVNEALEGLNASTIQTAHPHGGGVPTAPQVMSVERPPPHHLISSILDQRHHENVALIIKGQSSHDEHKSSELQQQKMGQSDSSEGKANGDSETKPLATTSSSGSGSNSSTTTTAPIQLSSGVASTVARLQHASGEMSKALDQAVESARAENILATKSKDVVGETTAGNVSDQRLAETIARTSAFDALAYSKSMNQPGDTMHVLFTSNGSPYQNFQARIMVATWRLAQKMPGGEKMVALTRILHRTTPDEIMDEVATFRADPLQPACDKWCWFPVADRANAVQQFLDAAAVNHSILQAPWLLLLETDYVWIKPLMALGSAYDLTVPGLSFAFGYINTRHPIVLQLLKERCSTCDPHSIPDSGPAPVLARYSDFRAATPLWEELSLWIENDKEAKAALGWVREMYAWDIGVAVHKLNIRNEGSKTTTLIAQPPHDTQVNNATMYHYTWGSIYEDKVTNKELWKFDKRFYTDPLVALKVPLLPLPPTWTEGIKLHEGQPVTQSLHATLVDMITHMNAGIATLPDITPQVPGEKQN